MKHLKGVLSFLLKNRRIIGGIIGSSLILVGYPKEGAALRDASELL